MKVLFLSQWYPHRYDNMAGLFVQKHAEAVSLYCDVAVLYVYPDDRINKLEIIKQQHNHITEYMVYYPACRQNPFYKIMMLVNFCRAYRKGFKLVFKTFGKPDIIQANVFTRTALVAYIIKIRHKIPYTVIEHWTRYFREKTFSNRIHKAISRLVAKKASAVTPVTHHLRKSMESHGMKNSNYQIINNVVDDVFFKHISSSQTSKIRISNITCFNDDHKNLSGIINVVDRLVQIRNDFEIYLIGDGIDFKKIKQLSEDKGLDNKVVFFTGTLVGDELVRYFQESHFTILFSNFENIPVVISESLACGKPVISTDVGGIKEHIKKNNGILIEKGDEDGLFNAINYMIDNINDYDSEKIREEAKNKYCYENVGKKLTEIYSDILKT